MTKTQKVILLCIAISVTIMMCGLALRSCLHEPARVDNTDSLKVFKDLAKKQKDTTVEEYKKYGEATKKYNAPADPVELEKLWTRIGADAKADSASRSRPR